MARKHTRKSKKGAGSEMKINPLNMPMRTGNMDEHEEEIIREERMKRFLEKEGDAMKALDEGYLARARAGDDAKAREEKERRLNDPEYQKMLEERVDREQAELDKENKKKKKRFGFFGGKRTRRHSRKGGKRKSRKHGKRSRKH